MKSGVVCHKCGCDFNGPKECGGDCICNGHKPTMLIEVPSEDYIQWTVLIVNLKGLFMMEEKTIVLSVVYNGKNEM